MTRASQHIVVFTGAGVSAESGLHTFRDTGGLWQQYPIEEVATRMAWKKDRQKVLHFYNLRRQQVRQAQPNAAHLALVKLQEHFQVTVITQNIDDLHERAGSCDVLHLHGEIMKARSTVNEHLLYDLGDKDIQLGDKCAKGSQLRPHVVWFGERVPLFEKACKIAKQADLLLVIGTSLQVYPAASLLQYVTRGITIEVVSLELENPPPGTVWYQEKAVIKIPALIDSWLTDGLPKRA